MIVKQINRPKNSVGSFPRLFKYLTTELDPNAGTRRKRCTKREVVWSENNLCSFETAPYEMKGIASSALALLNMTGHTALDQNHNSALITAAHLIRCASVEQLAIAIPVAIRETSTKNYWPVPVRFPEFSEIAACLLSLDNNTLSLERRISVRTALQLSTIVSRQQIHQSVRRSWAHINVTQSKQASRHKRGQLQTV